MAQRNAERESSSRSSTIVGTFDLVSLVEESPLGVFQTTPAGRFRYANRGLADILGYSSQKELIDSIQDIAQELLVDAKLREEVLRLFDRGEKVRRFEYQILRKDKTSRWVSFSARRVTQGDEVFFEGFLEDITEIKTLIGSLETSKSRLEDLNRGIEALLKNMPGMAYRCAPQSPWKMYHVSDGAEELTGYSADDLMNDNPTYGDIIVEDWKEDVGMRVAQAIARNEAFTLVYPITTSRDERRWVFERGRATKDAGGNQVLEGFITNYTEQKQAEEEARKRIRQAREAEIDKSRQDMELRRIIAWALIGIFVFTTLVVLGLVTHAALTSGLNQATLLGLFGGLVAELTGIVVLVAKYLFPGGPAKTPREC